MLQACARPLDREYDLAMVDLDGVVYVSGHAIPHAAEQLESARGAGMAVAFITNNAARPPDMVAEHLVALGVRAEVGDVVTSAQAAATLLGERLGGGARVAVLGSAGLTEVIERAGLSAVGPTEDAVAVVTGYGPDVPWRDIMQVAVRIRDGLWWVACNTDLTIPTAYGVAPGHGSLVGLLQGFSGVSPVVAGKPARPLLDETVRRVGGRRPLMIGDRLDTDIEGATRAGFDSLLVLTGVTGVAELVAAEPHERPTYLAPNLVGLSQAHPEVPVVDGVSRAGGWRAWVGEDRQLTVEGEGVPADWWRAIAAAAWAYSDTHGVPPQSNGLTPPA